MKRSAGQNDLGFTLIELVMVITILGILAVTVAVRWPQGLEEQGAVLELTRALRYTQHKAITRGYTTLNDAWGLVAAGNRYTVRRLDNGDQAEADYVNRALPGKVSLGAGSVWFNGLGEPINSATGLPLAGAVTFTVGASQVTVYPETGYAE
jgi:prepilin-type N-terminal cleavage/methylation domain-containing protein